MGSGAMGDSLEGTWTLSRSLGTSPGFGVRRASVVSMNRTCARPACPSTATVTLSYSYDDRTVVLDDLSSEPHPMIHDLCARHAGSVSAPVGWTVEDRRRADAARAGHRGAGAPHRLSA